MSKRKLGKDPQTLSAFGFGAKRSRSSESRLLDEGAPSSQPVTRGSDSSTSHLDEDESQQSSPDSPELSPGLRKKLRITIETNLKVANFLDLTLNLKNGKYYPFWKPNDTPLYVNRMSNHPPAILKELPAAISRRLTDISHDEEVFNSAAPLYNDALKKSRHSEKATYMEGRKSDRRKRKSRERRITWFNPPFSKSVTTNVAHRYLKLVDTHFPKGTKLHAILNRNTVKVSYSWMPNIDTLIKRHNTRVCAEEQKTDEQEKTCNCRQPSECPLSGECLASGIVYEATVKSAGSPCEMLYIGSTDTTFKACYGNHKASLTHENKANQTELSKYVWKLKNKGKDHKITWRIARRARGLTCKSRRCDLYLAQKLLIARANKRTLLNKRS